MDPPLDTPFTRGIGALIGVLVLALLWLELFTVVNVSEGLSGNSFLLIGLGLVALIALGIVEIVGDEAFAE